MVMLLYKAMLTVGWNKQTHPILKSHVLLILTGSSDIVDYFLISLKLSRRSGSDRSYRLCEFAQTTACKIVKHSLHNCEENGISYS